METVRSVTRSIKTWGVSATVVVMTALTPALAAPPDALSKTPQGAQFVMIVPSMSEFSGKIAMINQNLGIDSPELGDALSSFKAEIGIKQGLNDAGSAMVIIQDLATAIETNEEPDILIVLPVTDYQAFVSNFQAEGAAPAGEGTTEITMPDGQSGFVMESGGYAIMGNNAEALANYAPIGKVEALTGRIGEQGKSYLEKCDAAVYLDVKAMAPMLASKLEEQVAEMKDNFQQMAEMGMADEASLKSMDAASSMYASAGKAILEGADGLVMALDISDHGIGLTYAGQFQPESKVMQYLPGSNTSVASTLARLPQGSYIAAMAFNAEAFDVTKLADAVFAAFPEDDPQMAVYRKAQPLMGQMQQVACVFYTPDPAAMMSGTGMVNVLQTVKVKDPDTYMAKAKQYMKELNGTTIPMAMPMAQGGEAPSMKYITSYTDNALQLDGVQIDQYSMQMQMPQEMMMQMGPAAGMMQMFSNFTGYATMFDGHYIASTTLDQQLMAKGLAAAKNGDGIGSGDTVADVREKAVPEGAIGEGYLSISGLIDTLAPMAMMFGMPPVEAPENLPPIAAGLGMQDNSVALRLYVPNDTTKFIIDTAKDIQSQMMMGPQGPAQQQPGQGAPPPPF